MVSFSVRWIQFISSYSIICKTHLIASYLDLILPRLWLNFVYLPRMVHALTISSFLLLTIFNNIWWRVQIMSSSLCSLLLTSSPKHPVHKCSVDCISHKPNINSIQSQYCNWIDTQHCIRYWHAHWRHNTWHVCHTDYNNMLHLAQASQYWHFAMKRIIMSLIASTVPRFTCTSVGKLCLSSLRPYLQIIQDNSLMQYMS